MFRCLLSQCFQLHIYRIGICPQYYFSQILVQILIPGQEFFRTHVFILLSEPCSAFNMIVGKIIGVPQSVIGMNLTIYLFGYFFRG